MKIKHYNDAIDWLTRPKFNGGGSVKNKEVLPKRKPEEELKKRKKKRFEKLKEYLENPEEVEEMLELQEGGRIGFANGKSAAQRQREYRERNPYKLKTTDIVVDGVKYNIPNNAMKPESAKGFIKFLNKLEKDSSLENYRKLIAKESKPIQRVIRSYRAYLQNEKAGAFATGEGENLRKLFDELKLPNKSKNFLSKVTSKDIKGQIVKTATKAAGEAAKGTSMGVVNAVRDIFVNDPNNAPSLDDVAEGLEGTKKFNAASASEKIKMRTNASNAVNQFLQAVTADRKVKGFKDVADDTLGDIIQYIDDNKRGEFRFAEGVIRDYKIKLRDSLIKGDFGKQRRNIPGQKGKVIDEVFGLSATFENAPGYTENVQIISDKINKKKATQIDKPFAAILKAVKEGRDTITFDKKRNVPISEAIKDFNAKSKTFSNVNKISTPQIFVGDNLDATRLVSNFDKYSPQAQQNIKQLAKQGIVLNATKPSTPASTFLSGAKNVTQLNAKLPIISTMYDVAKSIPGDIGKAKYLSAGFKTLGLAVAPYVAYTTFQDLKAGKNLVETLERNLIGTDIIGGTKDILAMTPEEREARAKVKQEQIAELNIDMPTGFGFIEAPPVQTDMALEEAKQKLDAAEQRVAQQRAEDEAGVAAMRRQALDKVIDAATGNRTTAMKLAGGGLLKQAGKRSGPPPEKGPGGLASLEDYARTMME